MGGIVVYAYARQFPGDLKTVSMVDTPIPGLTGWDGLRNQWPRWHWAFHSFPDSPEALVSGRERIYLNWFLEYSPIARRFCQLESTATSRLTQSHRRCTPDLKTTGCSRRIAADNQDHESAKLTMPTSCAGSASNPHILDRHLSSDGVSLRAQVSFPHGAVLIDDERHDPGRVVLAGQATSANPPDISPLTI